MIRLGEVFVPLLHVAACDGLPDDEGRKNSIFDDASRNPCIYSHLFPGHPFLHRQEFFGHVRETVALVRVKMPLQAGPAYRSIL